MAGAANTNGDEPAEYAEAHLYARAFLNQIVVATNLLVVFTGVLFAGLAAFSDTLLGTPSIHEVEFVSLLFFISIAFCLIGAISLFVVCFFCYRMLENIRICFARARDFEQGEQSLSRNLAPNFERAIRRGQVFYIYVCFCCILSGLWIVVLVEILRGLFR